MSKFNTVQALISNERNTGNKLCLAAQGEGPVELQTCWDRNRRKWQQSYHHIHGVAF